MGMSQQEVASLCFSTPEMLRQWKYHILWWNGEHSWKYWSLSISKENWNLSSERLDPQTLSLGRSGLAEGEAAGSLWGDLNEVWTLNGDLGIIACSEPHRFYYYPLSPFCWHALLPTRQFTGGAFSREIGQPREKHLQKFGGVPIWDFPGPVHLLLWSHNR